VASPIPLAPPVIQITGEVIRWYSFAQMEVHAILLQLITGCHAR
jgi:hypothetical protein